MLFSPPKILKSHYVKGVGKYILCGLILCAGARFSSAESGRNQQQAVSAINLDLSASSEKNQDKESNGAGKEGASGSGFSSDWNAPVESAQSESAGDGDLNFDESTKNDLSENKSGSGKIGHLQKKSEGALRKNQFNRRLGLSAYGSGQVNAKEFEKRGKDLQDTYYEIGGIGKMGEGVTPVKKEVAIQDSKSGINPWLIWVGAAGLAGASAGVVGFLLMDTAHPSSPPPKILVLTDQ